MANEFVARNGVIALNNSIISGSLIVTGSITGSLSGSHVGDTTGTASWATSASNAISAAYAPGGASLSGGSTNYAAVWASTTTLTTGSIFVTQSNVGIGTLVPAAKLQVSGTVNVVNFKGSGSLTTQSIFTVDGAAGRLFSVNDSLSGSLFSVNTIAGLPVIEAFSDNTVRIGQYGQRVLFVSQSRVGIGKETALNASIDISGSAIITGSLNVTGSITTVGTITATTLVVQTITSSIEYSSGSNIFGSKSTDTQQFTGSVGITGSLTSNGNTIITGSFTIFSGSLIDFQVTDGGTKQGNSATDIHNVTGSLIISGSITGSRINPRAFTTASTSTFTPDVNIGDIFTITAQTSSLILANPIGTPVEGQKIIIRIKDNGTARALITGSQYRASTDLAFPLSSSLNKTLYLGLIYNSTDTKWDLIASLNNF